MDDELQKIYDVVPRTEDVFNLNKRELELHDKLGKILINRLDERIKVFLSLDILL